MEHRGSERWSADRVRRELMRDDRAWPRYEFVDGEVRVTPAPRPAHYDVQMALYDRVREYVATQGVGRTFVSPSDLALETDSAVQPDLYVVPGTPRLRLRAWSDVTRLLLAVEVLSPSTARYDRLAKRRYYARNGVPEYWIVDVDTRLVERSGPDGRVEVLGDRLQWHPEGADEPFVLDLPAFFHDALGDDAKPDDAKPDDA